LGISAYHTSLWTHIYLTIRLKFIQKFIGKAIKISLRLDKEGKVDISQGDTFSARDL